MGVREPAIILPETKSQYVYPTEDGSEQDGRPRIDSRVSLSLHLVFAFHCSLCAQSRPPAANGSSERRNRDTDTQHAVCFRNNPPDRVGGLVVGTEMVGEEEFHEWSKVYGPIYQTKMFGVTHVWISSEKIAHDLLSRRANIYSDRPQIPNLPDNRTSGDYLALLGRNDTWRRQRKLCNHLMHTSALASLHDYPTLERNRFLYLLSQSPENYIEYIEQFTSRTIARLSWGSAHPAQILRHTTFGLLETISPSGALPNVISFLRHLPLALSPWQKKEKARHELEDKQFRSNIGFVKRMMDVGRAEPSFIRTYLEEQGSIDSTNKKCDEQKGKEAADEAMHVVGLMAIAGALTIGSPIQSYILAMCHYPEWQARLQEEIDTELAGRCPMWEDREKLPLLRAVVKEVIRWRPPVPTGIPHAVEKDDVYNGYFIPAGATIHALEWAITRDEQTYPQAETFNPSRFLLPSYPTYREPLTIYPNLSGFSQFGFGRRTCQGVPIVEQDLFLTMGGMAWAFTISKKRDPVTGVEMPVHWNDYTPLLIAKPCRFPFDAVPRDEEKLKKMREMYEEAMEGEEMERCESREETERTEGWMVEGGVRQKEEEIPWQSGVGLQRQVEGDVGAEAGAGAGAGGGGALGEDGRGHAQDQDQAYIPRQGTHQEERRLDSTTSGSGSASASGSVIGTPSASWGSEPSLSLRGSSAESSDCDEHDELRVATRTTPYKEEDGDDEGMRIRSMGRMRGRRVRIKAVSNASSTTGMEALMTPMTPTTPEKEGLPFKEMGMMGIMGMGMKLGIATRRVVEVEDMEDMEGVAVDDEMEVPGAWRW
ncbi:cytochrome P450 [Neurospora hispaniola]|uniref:Cytochrome P450 n=1 Tax=Neurospora hispaniola TaxID=588809 RepID=A0AAJ0IAY7_9PEZI|nr:cytochrome P450 [Neurospora hispaniola]